MSKVYEYRSVFAPYIRAFIDMKSKMMRNADIYAHTLYQWDQAMTKGKYTELYVTKNMYEYWSTRLGPICDRTSYTKHSQIITFLKYLCRMGVECHIPRVPKRPRSMYIPYVYTHEEIERIFTAIDNTTSARYHHKYCLISMPCFFRLLYATGIRISEALALKNKDVDFDNEYFVLNHTKSGKQRIIPMNAEVKSVLLQYVRYRNRMPIEGIDAESRYLFVSGIGKPFHPNIAYTFFKKILKQCGIVHKGKNQGPHVHDLRHTFAVHTLQKMAVEGVDLYAGLPVLSVLLGHAGVRETEWYLRLTKQFFPEVIDLISSSTGRIFPEIDQNNKYHGKGN